MCCTKKLYLCFHLVGSSCNLQLFLTGGKTMGKRDDLLSEGNSDPVPSLHYTAASTWEALENNSLLIP